MVAEHADVWNIPGGDIDDAVSRSRLLDRYCADIERDPSEITRSITVSVSYDRPDETRRSIAEVTAAGFRHVVLTVPAPYPPDVARWIVDELITSSR